MKTTFPAMTALERQRARPLEWLYEKGTAQFEQQTQSFCDSGGGGNGGTTLSFYPGDENLMGLGEVVNQYNMMDLCAGLEYWSQLGEIEVPSLRFGGGIAAAAASSGYQVTCGGISRTASCPSAAVEAATGRMLEQAAEKTGAPVGKDSFRKRKLERAQCTKCSEEETRDKKIKGCSDEIGSKITEQSHSNNGGNKEDTKNSSSNKKDTSASTSKDKSKASEIQKTDYIHVRARRGQATDSHSLAERVRREKISARMKFLQGLVPGCSKVTGKAGMLDEIINYVQSLQRQVELLSMKIATVDPRLDFNNDSLFSMEMIPACTSSFPVMDMSSDLTSTTYLQLDPMSQVVPSSDLKMGIVNPDAAHQLTTIAPVSVPQPFIDSSCFAMQPTPAWDSGFQNLYSMEFQQGKPTASAHRTLQQYTGPIEHTNMKMEF